MSRVRVRDLALVAFAGGLLAFELATIGEALPKVKKAFADRGLSGRVDVASASAAGVPASAPCPSGSAAPRVVVGTAIGHVHLLAAVTSPALVKRCVVVTRATKGQRSDGRLRVVTIKSDVSSAVGAMAQSLEWLRDVEKLV